MQDYFESKIDYFEIGSVTVTELSALSRVTEGPIVCHEEVAGPDIYSN